MGEDVKLYDLSEGGVNLVKSDHHMANNELRQAQNAAFGKVETGGGIETRAGMAKFNAEAMDGAVVGFVNVPLADLREGGGGVGEIMYPASDIEAIDQDPDLLGSLNGGESTLWETLRDLDDATYWRVETDGPLNAGTGQGWGTVLLESPAETPVGTAGHQLVLRIRVNYTSVGHSFSNPPYNQWLDVQFKTAAGFATTYGVFIGNGDDFYTESGYTPPFQEAPLITAEDTWTTITIDLEAGLVTELLANDWFDDPRLRPFLGGAGAEMSGDEEWTADLAQIHYVIPAP